MDKIIAWLGDIVVALALLLAAVILTWSVACATLNLVGEIRDMMIEIADGWKRGDDPDE
jgi:hypothetical protein